MSRSSLPMLTLFLVLVIASPAASTPVTVAAKKCVAAKKKTKKCPKKKTASTTLKDGTYTFKNDRGKVNTLKISGGGKKVTISFVHFGGGAPGQFPYCAETLVNHGTFTLKPDYVFKTRLAFTSPTDTSFSTPVPPIQTDGNGGGGADATGTIDPKKLTISGQFSVKMYPTADRGPNVAYTCLESPSVTDAKLTKTK